MADETVAEMVARTRAEQGLPPKVTDPAALAKVAEILADHDDEAAAS